MGVSRPVFTIVEDKFGVETDLTFLVYPVPAPPTRWHWLYVCLLLLSKQKLGQISAFDQSK